LCTRGKKGANPSPPTHLCLQNDSTCEPHVQVLKSTPPSIEYTVTKAVFESESEQVPPDEQDTEKRPAVVPAKEAVFTDRDNTRVIEKFDALRRLADGATHIDDFLYKIYGFYQRGALPSRAQLEQLARNTKVKSKGHEKVIYITAEERNVSRNKVRLVYLMSRNLRTNQLNFALGVINLVDNVFYGFLSSAMDQNRLFDEGIGVELKMGEDLSDEFPELDELLAQFAGLDKKTPRDRRQSLMRRLFKTPELGLTL
jgi:hypothetical protein